ncbi:MAG: 6-pyruvoyl trahydropterin synthase family protein [Pseudoramibacter sp.]
MYTLKTQGHFDAAHFLKGYQGKCANLHGHRWTVTAEIQGAALQTDVQHRGMLVDFGDLKKDLRELCDGFDHCLIYEDGSLSETALQALEEEGFRLQAVPFRPTAENLAASFAEKMTAKGYDVRRVEVYETPDNMAAYEPEKEGE